MILLWRCLVVASFFVVPIYAIEDAPESTDNNLPSLVENADESSPETYDETSISDEDNLLSKPRRINAIIVKGNKLVPTEAILHKAPYHVGEIFNPIKTRKFIHSLYFDLKRLRNIKIYGEPVDDDLINIHVVVEEKIPVKDIIFKGNSQISEDEIAEKTECDEIPAIDPLELNIFAQKIKKLYMEKGYFNATIDHEFILDEYGKATVIFTIHENKKSAIKRINFIGNKSFPAKILRNIIYSREDWLLSFLDRSSMYHPEKLEADKQSIEHFYQSNGFLNARVLKIIPDVDPSSKDFNITFDIEEGQLYTISEVRVPGNDLLPEEFLAANLPMRAGMLYSRERVVESIKILERLWGNLGYIFAHIEPIIQPDEDNKTVSIAFHSEIGKQIMLNKLTIRGNKKTRDKVVRRALSLTEGNYLTTAGMEESKNRVMSLGYFDQRDGVNWKTTRISDTEADLDLMLKETRTGHAGLQLGFSGSERSIKEPLTGLAFELGLADTNIAGTGIRGNLMGRFSHQDLTFSANLTQPWLFDKPILGVLDAYHKRIAYEEFNFATAMNEIDTGGAVTFGFVARFNNQFLRDTFIRAGLFVDNIIYQAPPQVSIPPGFLPNLHALATQQYSAVLNKEFTPGDFVSLNLQMGQEKRNHPMHPSAGYSWLSRSIFAFSVIRGNLGFYKFDTDVHWYTPLIGMYDLIFHVHGFLGIIVPVKNRVVPYRELFHIGGPASVRGFLYGQIGPQFSPVDISSITDNNVSEAFRGDSLGGARATFFSAELIFPIMPDFSIKGLAFYDGGAGWNNPYSNEISKSFLRGNTFSYRHAVGFGLRILNPVPARIDWGFKLDAKPGESPYEVHFNMSYDW